MEDNLCSGIRVSVEVSGSLEGGSRCPAKFFAQVLLSNFVKGLAEVSGHHRTYYINVV